MEVFRVRDVQEAVSLAVEFKDTGKYDWFRGQRRPWNPASTVERKVGTDPGKLGAHLKRIRRFLTWAQQHPSLSYLAEPENAHAAMAVMQHYGIPTTYIDFTAEPSVAAFFAMDGAPEEVGESVIFCLNTKELTDAYKSFGTVYRNFAIEAIETKVHNLWRLEAQHGRFVFANHAWYTIYPMDRILFPSVGILPYPQREQVYPVHKSQLEQALDEYFAYEMRLDGTELARAVLGNQVVWLDMEGNDSSHAFHRELNVLSSWGEEEAAYWLPVHVEQFNEAVGRTIQLRIDLSNCASVANCQVAHGVASVLRSKPELRKEAVEWRLVDIGVSSSESLRLEEALREVWNGMRRLPFTDSQISCAMGSVVEMCTYIGVDSFVAREQRSAFKELMHDAIEVELGWLSSVSRAFCSESELVAAIDEEWRASLVTQRDGSSATTALRYTSDPKLLFHYPKFLDIFAARVIPSQVAMRRRPVLFNPIRLTAFGLP